METNTDEKCLWRIQWIQDEHHCCRFTEVKEDEPDLDHLAGEIWFSKELTSRQLDFKITLVATDSLRSYKNLSDGNIANLRIHPNLLYITRYDDIRKSGDLHPRRLFNQESRIPMWRVELRIVNGKVDWWTESEAQPGGYYQHICYMEKDEEGNWILPLQMLHLIVIIPLQRTNATGLKILEALLLRRAMYEEIDEDQWEKLVKELERFYKKDGKAEMDKFCLQFDCTLDPGTMLQTRLSTLLSEPIFNSKNKTCANFDLHGSISHEKSCTQFQRSTHLFFKFPISSNNQNTAAAIGGSGQPEVSVRFVTRHKHRQEYVIDKRLNQPSEIRIEAYWAEFDIPFQYDHVIQSIYKANHEIYIEGYRPKDKFRTKTKVKFHYQTHQENSFCIFCSSNPDKIGLDLLSDSLSPPLPRKRSRLNGELGDDNLDANSIDSKDSFVNLSKESLSDNSIDNKIESANEKSDVLPKANSNDNIAKKLLVDEKIDWDDVDAPKKNISPTFTKRTPNPSPTKMNRNGKAAVNGLGNGSKKMSRELSFIFSPRHKPTEPPSFLSFCTFTLFPACLIISLVLFHQDFPSITDILQMWQWMFYVVSLPTVYQILCTRYNLTQSASTVLAFTLCFGFLQLVAYIF